MALQLSDPSYISLLSTFSATGDGAEIDGDGSKQHTVPSSLFRLSSRGLFCNWFLRAYDWELARRVVSLYVGGPSEGVDQNMAMGERVSKVICPLLKAVSYWEDQLFKDLTLNDRHGLSCLAFDVDGGSYQFQGPLLQAVILDRLTWAIIHRGRSELSMPHQIKSVLRVRKCSSLEGKVEAFRDSGIVKWRAAVLTYCKLRKGQSSPSADVSSLKTDVSVVNSLLSASRAIHRQNHFLGVEANFCDAAVALNALMLNVTTSDVETTSDDDTTSDDEIGVDTSSDNGVGAGLSTGADPEYDTSGNSVDDATGDENHVRTVPKGANYLCQRLADHLHLEADATIRSWKDLDLLRPLYAAVAFGSTSLLGKFSISPRGHGKTSLGMFSEASCLGSGEWTRERLRIEFDIWNLIVDMALSGHKVFRPSMDRLVDSWMALGLFSTDRDPEIALTGSPDLSNSSIVTVTPASETVQKVHDYIIRHITSTKKKTKGGRITQATESNKKKATSPSAWFDDILKKSTAEVTIAATRSASQAPEEQVVESDRQLDANTDNRSQITTGTINAVPRKRQKKMSDENVIVRRSGRHHSSATYKEAGPSRSSHRKKSGAASSQTFIENGSLVVKDDQKQSEMLPIFTGVKRKAILIDLDDLDDQLATSIVAPRKNTLDLQESADFHVVRHQLQLGFTSLTRISDESAPDPQLIQLELPSFVDQNPDFHLVQSLVDVNGFLADIREPSADEGLSEGALAPRRQYYCEKWATFSGYSKQLAFQTSSVLHVIGQPNGQKTPWQSDDIFDILEEITDIVKVRKFQNDLFLPGGKDSIPTKNLSLENLVDLFRKSPSAVNPAFILKCLHIDVSRRIQPPDLRFFDDGLNLRHAHSRELWKSPWPSDYLGWASVTTNYATEALQMSPRGVCLYKHLIIGKKMLLSGVPRSSSLELATLARDKSGFWDLPMFTWRVTILHAGDHLYIQPGTLYMFFSLDHSVETNTSFYSSLLYRRTLSALMAESVMPFPVSAVWVPSKPLILMNLLVHYSTIGGVLTTPPSYELALLMGLIFLLHRLPPSVTDDGKPYLHWEPADSFTEDCRLAFFASLRLLTRIQDGSVKGHPRQDICRGLIDCFSAFQSVSDVVLLRGTKGTNSQHFNLDDFFGDLDDRVVDVLGQMTDLSSHCRRQFELVKQRHASGRAARIKFRSLEDHGDPAREAVIESMRHAALLDAESTCNTCDLSITLPSDSGANAQHIGICESDCEKNNESVNNATDIGPVTSAADIRNDVEMVDALNTGRSEDVSPNDQSNTHDTESGTGGEGSASDGDNARQVVDEDMDELTNNTNDMGPLTNTADIQNDVEMVDALNTGRSEDVSPNDQSNTHDTESGTGGEGSASDGDNARQDDSEGFEVPLSNGKQVQINRCADYGRDFRLSHCVSCTEQPQDEGCRFQGIRILSSSIKHGTSADRFLSIEEGINDVTLEFPPIRNVSFNKDHAERTQTAVAKFLHPILQKELARYHATPAAIQIYYDPDSRHDCDYCATSVFTGGFMCQWCGRDVCEDCAAVIEQLEIHEKKRGCHERTTHSFTDLIAISRLSEKTLARELDRMEICIKCQHPDLLVRDSDFLSDLGIDGHDTGHDALMFDAGAFTDELFDKVWCQGRPIVVSGLTEKFGVHLTPAFFIGKYGNDVCEIYNPKSTNNIGKKATVGKFFSGFGKYKNRKSAWKLKDWPPSNDFKNVFPEIFNDFLSYLPAPTFSRRDGALNISSHYPDNALALDLGPKMYNAYASEDKPGSKGTTRLHMDAADAVNVMAFTEHTADGDQGGAIWDIYRAEDSNAIREFIGTRFPEYRQPGTDPIHSQQIYLDATLREELRERYHVQSYRIVQRVGDAVFIPAGCAHQVCNLSDCVKIACDFVSPHNIDRCAQLTKEFRLLEGRWKDDILQLRLISWYAWLYCSSVDTK